jgi:hypothetical protein
MSIDHHPLARRRPGLLVLVGVALAAGCGGHGDTTPNVSARFDGTQCEYDGPERMPAGDIDVSFVNDSDGAAGLAFLRLPAGMPTDDPAVGDNGPITNPEPEAGVEIVGAIELDPGTDANEVAALAPGTHAIDCVTLGPNGPDHYWRAAILNVER